MKHYDADYFNWQKNVGAFGGEANQFKFVGYIKPTDNVIDFGCGGAFLLGNLNCAGKKGIEINETAREQARKHGIDTYPDASGIPDQWADVIISNNALEHTLTPFEELKKLLPKLKPGGTAVFVVPHELKSEFGEGDIHQHLYTWSPANAGNLFKAAGYKVKSVDTIKHLWPRSNYVKVRQKLGRRGFHLVSYFYGLLFGTWQQTRVVAQRPD